MSLSTVTVGSNTYTLVSSPTSPQPSDIELTFGDATAMVRSPFSGQTQTFQWPGGDWIKATITLPPLTMAQSRLWEAFFGELRGNANVFQLGDPRPQSGTGTGTPLTNGATSAMATTLSTSGWTAFPSVGDWLQVQSRIYKIININSSGGTAAVFEIFPSIREAISASTAVTYATPKGLFRLANAERTINWSPSRLTTLSFQAMEAR